jgi:hypothetical protein
MHRPLTTLTLSVVAAFAAALCASPQAGATASEVHVPIVITPSSGCGLLTAYTAGPGLPAWSSPAPPCGAGPFTLAFNQGNTTPLATGSPLGGVAMAGSALLAWSTSVPEGARMGYQITAPPGITIDNVAYDDSQLQNIANGRGWIGLIYWNGGTSQVHPNGTAFDAAVSAPSSPTNYWGIELRCVQSVCTWPGKIQLNSLTVYATEAQGPSITPVTDPSSLWAQTGHWIWNTPNDPWPLPLATADPSGVCSLSFQAGASTPVADPSLPAQQNSSWQECQQPASWTPAVDTNTPGYVTSTGQMPLSLQATNAAELANAPMSETLSVDDHPVSISLSTPNDPNPTVWVNHAITVDATPSTGPSGLGGMSCGVNGGPVQSYPAGGLLVDGDGVKTVSCTAWNNAVDPQGNHNTGTSSVTVHIDEAPPAVSLAPVNPNDPTGIVADTSDGESGVAGGSIEMASEGSNSWTALPTTFNGGQLVAHFDDAALRGLYIFRVQSCDNLGNCASTSRTISLPARAQAVSEVSLEQLSTARCPSAPVTRTAVEATAPSPDQRMSRAEQAGKAGLTVSLDRKARRVRDAVVAMPIANAGILAGADAGSIRSLSHPRRQARAARTTAHRHRDLRRSCSRSTANLATRAVVGFGRSVKVQRLLMTSSGLPLAGQQIAVMTAPDNGSDAFSEAAAVTTGPDGRWTATLAPGSSRIIEASYAGSPTILPATGSATVITPAKIVLTRVTPARTPWGSTVRITGRVLGGYIPASSKLLRLDLGIVGIPGLSKIQGIPNVAPDGTFTTTYKFAHYQGVVRFWLQVSSLAEADFPWAPAHSRRVIVTVGVAAPPPAASRPHHHHKHKHRARPQTAARRDARARRPRLAKVTKHPRR